MTHGFFNATTSNYNFYVYPNVTDHDIDIYKKNDMLVELLPKNTYLYQNTQITHMLANITRDIRDDNIEYLIDNGYNFVDFFMLNKDLCRPEYRNKIYYGALFIFGEKQ